MAASRNNRWSPYPDKLCLFRTAYTTICCPRIVSGRVFISYISKNGILRNGRFRWMLHFNLRSIAWCYFPFRFFSSFSLSIRILRNCPLVFLYRLELCRYSLYFLRSLLRLPPLNWGFLYRNEVFFELVG